MGISLVLRLTVILLACTAIAPSATAQVAKILPVDEAAEDPSFFLFRARLLSAAAERDTAFLYAHLSPGIKNSFGGEGGIPEFREMWQPELPQSRLWPLLVQILGRGGTLSRDPGGEHATARFMAPYTYAAYSGEFDAFTHGVVVGENVRVRAAPDLGSEVIATLSYDVIRVPSFMREEDDEPPPDGWERVELRDGQVGYVAAEYVVSPIGYRAAFEKQAGRWFMTFLIAGD